MKAGQSDYKSGPLHVVIGGKKWFSNFDEYKSVNIQNPTLHGFYLKDKYPDGIKFEKVEDLKNYDIGYILGGSFTKILAAKNMNNVQFVKTNRVNIQKLYMKRIDVAVMTLPAGLIDIRQLYPKEVDKFGVLPKVVMQPQGYTVFSSVCDNYYHKFKQGLINIWDNGRYEKIMFEYYAGSEHAKNTIPPELKSR